MKKQLLTLLFLLTLCVPASFADTYSWEFSGKSNPYSSSILTVKLGDINWTLSYSGSISFAYDNQTTARGMQFGSSSKKPNPLTLKTSEIEGTITKVTVNTSGSNSPNATVGVKVGETDFSNAGTSSKITATATNYTFTGSASGEISINWTGNTKGGIYVKSITVEYTPNGTAAKEDNELAWSAESYEYTMGEAIDAPTLANPNNLTVSYSSSDEAVATIDATGSLEIVGAGTTTISATFDGDDTYKNGTVSYELTVTEPIDPNAIVDVIDADFDGFTNTYQEYTIESANGITYKLYAYKNAGLQFNHNGDKNNQCGLVVTDNKNGYYLKSIKFNWKSGNNKSFDLYGNSEAYSSTEDIAKNTIPGTKLTTISTPANTTINDIYTYSLEDDYEFICLDNVSGSVVVNSIEFTWVQGLPQVATPTYEFINYLNLPYADVQLACETEGATYKYTIDSGEELTATNGKITFTEYGTYELTFWAEKEGMRASKKTTETIVYKDPFEMSFNLEPGEYPYGTEVTVTIVSADAARYSTFGYEIVSDDSNVSKSDVAFEDLKFTLTNDCTITVKLHNNTADVDRTLTGSFTVSAPAAPTFSLEGGLVLAGTEVTLTAAEGMSIYYTTDGTVPSDESTLYTAPIVITDDTTVSAVAYIGTIASTVAEAKFDVQNSLAEINLLEAGDKVLYSGELTVVFASGNNIYVYDGSDYTLLYQSGLGLTADNVIKAGWSGKVSPYNGLFEIQSISGIEVDADATPLVAVPVEVRRNDYEKIVTLENMHAYVEIKNIEITGLSNKNFTSAFGTLYNQLNCNDYSQAGHYDVVGFVGYYEKGTTQTLQIYPATMTALENPMIKVYWHNHNGNVSIDWAAPHVHYSLDGETYEEPVEMTPSATPMSIKAYADAATVAPNDWEAEIPATATHVFFTNNGDQTKKTEASEAVDGKHYVASDNDVTGIENIAAETAPAEYFNLQGIRIANPTPGNVYILRQGSKSSKVILN